MFIKEVTFVNEYNNCLDFLFVNCFLLAIDNHNVKGLQMLAWKIHKQHTGQC